MGEFGKMRGKMCGRSESKGADPYSDVAVLVTDAVHASHAVADLLRELLPLEVQLLY